MTCRWSVRWTLCGTVGVVRRGPLEHPTGRGRTRREQERIRTAHRRFTRVGSVPSSDRSMPTVPHAWTRPRPSGQADSLPEVGGENGKAATDRRDRSGRESWTFDREPDRGNALMIRFSAANPSRAYSRTNVSVRHQKPNKGAWLSHYVRLHELYINTVGTVSKTRKIYPLYTN